MRMNTSEFRDLRNILLKISLVLIEKDSRLLRLIYEYPKLPDLLVYGILENYNEEKNLSALLKRLLEMSSHKCFELYQRIIEYFFFSLWPRALHNSQNRNEKFWSFIREAYVSIYELGREINSQNEGANKGDEMNDESNQLQKENRMAMIVEVQNNVQKVLMSLVEIVKTIVPQTREQELKFTEILTTIKIFLSYSPSEYTSIAGLKMGFYDELIDNCLFTSLKDENREPKCKNQDSIQAALAVLAILVTNPKMQLEFCKFVLTLHLEGHWRKHNFHSWRITRMKELNNVDYNGLKNLGCSKNY